MVGRRIESVEAMIFVLDLRSIGYDEANLAETAHDVVGYLRERVQLAERAAASGQGEVGGFLRQRGLEFKFLAARGQSGFELDLGFVDPFAGGRAILFGQRAELFHQGGEFAVCADPVSFRAFQRSRIGRARHFRERGLLKRFDFIEERRHGILLAAKKRKRHKRN